MKNDGPLESDEATPTSLLGLLLSWLVGSALFVGLPEDERWGTARGWVQAAV